MATQNTTVTLENGAILSLGTAEIQGMSLSSSGALVIVGRDGATLTVENFRDLGQQGAKLALADGQTIDAATLFETLAGTGPLAATEQTVTTPEAVEASTSAEAIVIGLPQPGTVEARVIQPGVEYAFGFDPRVAQMGVESGNLVLRFADGATLILTGFESAVSADQPAILTLAGGQVIDGIELVSLARAAQLERVEPAAGPELHRGEGTDQNMAALAEQLAAVEPAAGEGSAGSRGGFGFQSAVDPAPLGAPPPVGPLGPTELFFGLPKVDYLPYPEFPAPAPLNPPTLIVNGGNVNIGIPDVIVKEDGSVFVPIVATLDPNGPETQVLTVTVTGIDPSWGLTNADGTYDAATGTWTITMPVGQNYNGGLTFTPPADSDIDMNGLTATATMTDPASGTTLSVDGDFRIITDAVADTPDLSATAPDTKGAALVPITINTAPTDTDGSEVIVKVTISGLPNGAALSAGTDLGGGVWELTPAQLPGLTMTPPAGFVGTINLTVVSTVEETNLSGLEVDFTDNVATATQVLTFTIARDDQPVLADPAIKTVDETNLVSGVVTVSSNINANFGVDGPGTFGATGTFTSGVPLTSDGVPVVVTLNGNTYTGTAGGKTIFTLQVSPTGSYTFNLIGTLDHPDATDPNDPILLNFGIYAADIDNDRATGTVTIRVLDDAPLANDDVNNFDLLTGGTNGNVVTGLNGGPGAADTLSQDTPNAVVSVTFNGTTVTVPATGTVTVNGTYGALQIAANGTYTYTLHDPAQAVRDKATSEQFTYALVDGDGDGSSAKLTLNFAPPQVLPPTLLVNNGVDDVIVKEDGSVFVPIVASLDPAGPATQVLTVTVTGIDPSWTLTNANGTYNAGTGTWTITLPAGQNYNGGLTFAPPADSDADMSGLSVTATAHEPVTNLSASTNDGFRIITDAVADKPTLDASADTVRQGNPVVINISSAVTDTDGSEAITGYKISGVPNGFAFNQGTDLGGGVWSFTPAQISGLLLYVQEGYHGAFNLVIRVENAETSLSGLEVDYTDNTNYAEKTLKITIDRDDVPVLTDPAIKTVDETNLVSGVVTVSSNINANFGVDGPGTFGATGTFTSGVPLTSDGVPVVVTLNGNTYTGTAGGKTIFTLQVSPTGSYTFNLIGTLDHPDATDPNDPILLNFGIYAADIDNDRATGTVTIRVLDDAPLANDDVNNFDLLTGGTNGNVVTGLNGGPGAADTLSQDTPNAVVSVTFNGTTVTVPATGTVTVNGTYGALQIAANGTYTYTLHDPAQAVRDKATSEQFTYALVDGDGDGSSAKLTLNFAPPQVLPPTLLVNNGVDDVIVKEDGSVFVPIVASLDPAGPATQVLTVTVTGIDPSWTLTNANGTYNAGTGTWTITLPAGQNYNGGLTFAPPADSDADMSGLSVTATAHEPVTNLSASTNDGFRIITDAVADKPTLDASADTVRQGNPVVINISSAVTDTDGSEAITGYKISGVPNGFAFNQGTDLGGGVWSFTPAQISGLLLYVQEGYHGAFNLVIRVENAETSLSGLEVDYTDNTNYAEKTLKITIDRDDVPQVQDITKLVDETNLASGTVSVSGALIANFGVDGPGTFAATDAGSFSASGSVAGGVLTSGGVPVSVTLVGNTYTGRAGGDVIFTLTVNNNGQYSFNLIGTLDHADGTDPNDVIALKFGFIATDKDGDSGYGTITINVADDGVIAVNDYAGVDSVSGVVTGNVLSNDTLSQDDVNVVSKIQFGGTTIDVPATGQATVHGAWGVLKISADGQYSYTSNGSVPQDKSDAFTYTLRDGDGDTDTATLNVSLYAPTLLVGKNVDDVPGSSTPYQVGTGTGTITGGKASDILIGDVGGVTRVDQIKDYNVVLMLDVSGSMAGNPIAQLREAVKNLLADFNSYQGGTVTVHMIPFGTNVYAGTVGTFEITDATSYAQAVAYVNALQSYTGSANYTNYETPLMGAAWWLENEAPTGADNYAYFVSDGQPNRYLGSGGITDVRSGSASLVMAEITGSDGTNEVADLKALTVEVIGVGINVDAATLANISIISDNPALDVQNPSDLSAALQGANPLNQIAGVGDDMLVGGDGDDIIFGDSLNTDSLAQAYGLAATPGSGWDVFARLEAGESALAPAWSRADTIDYIRANAVDLAAETIGNDGQGRSGGDDVIYGGAGNDLIFGQEGDDVIYGGLGNNVLYGGSGADRFVMRDALDGGKDTIKDFSLAEGDILDLSELLAGTGFTQAAINDFVFATDTSEGLVIKVDLSGSGNEASATTVAVLSGVHGLDLDTLLTAGAVSTVV